MSICESWYGTCESPASHLRAVLESVLTSCEYLWLVASTLGSSCKYLVSMYIYVNKRAAIMPAVATTQCRGVTVQWLCDNHASKWCPSLYTVIARSCTLLACRARHWPYMNPASAHTILGYTGVEMWVSKHFNSQLFWKLCDMALRVVTQRYSFCFSGSMEPTMEIYGLIESYHHIEYIYCKFGP